MSESPRPSAPPSQPAQAPARPPLGWRRPWDALGGLLSMLYAIPAWFYPPGNDQALHWYIGQGLLHGELPFAHGVSGKPIGIFVVHAISGLVFGTGQWTIRVFETLTLLAIAAMLPVLVRAPSEAPRDGEFGACALLLAGVHYTFFDYWDISHPETWVSLCIVAASVVALRDPRPTRRVLWVGALCGAAFMIKYTAALIALPIAGYCGLRAMGRAVEAQRSPWVALVLAALQFLAGVAAVFAACVAPFVFGDALGPMWEVLYTFTARYVKQAPGVPYTSLWIRFLFGGYALTAAGLLLAVGIGLQLKRRQRAAALRGLMLLVLTAAALLTVWLQKRFFSYHFMVTAPWLAVCMLFGLRAWLGETGMRRAGLRLVATSLALVALAFAAEPRWCTNKDMSYARHWQRLYTYLSDDMSRVAYLRPFIGINYLDHYYVHEHIGLAIRKRARPGDQACARGFAPSIYQVSGLRCPSRHVIQMWPAGLPHWEDEFWQTIETKRPRFIVTFRDRPEEIKRLRGLGYRARFMPSIYVLMELAPSRLQHPRPAPKPKQAATPTKKPVPHGP